MNCQRCGSVNIADNSFCNSCGAPLDMACSVCNHPNKVGSRFCGRCGARLTPPGARSSRSAENPIPSSKAGAAERKRITVLFADISNSTGLIQDMDPELGVLRLQPVLKAMRDAVDRYEGTVNKTQGDGIMALFGTPKPHEDHAVRGCLAALAMQDAVGRLSDPNISIRVGVHTGEMVFHKVHETYDVLGSSVHLASRMEHMAESGKILLTTDTFAAAKQFVEALPLGPRIVRGLSTPIDVYELTGLKHAPASEYFRHGPRPSPLFGRDSELAALELELRNAKQDQARVVCVVGDAGVGKSRLCFEFGEACRRRDIRVLEARVLEHGGATPFQPVLDLFRDFFGIKSKEPIDVSQGRIVDVLRARGDFSDAIPLLLDFLGIPGLRREVPKLNPETRKLRLLDFVRKLVRSRPGNEVAVILVEDLHWIDSASLDFIETMGDAIVGTKTILLLNCRPGFAGTWTQRSHYRQINLEPLNPEATDKLLQELLGDNPSLRSLRNNIAERARGNPFFLEELVRSVIDRVKFDGQAGAHNLSSEFDPSLLPPTVQAVIAARIDRLDERTKQILQTAAVIGREVPLAILQTVTELPSAEFADVIWQLHRTELLYELPGGDESIHAFRHPLIQEVAYQSLLLSRRRELHAAVARAIESHYKERLNERAGLLAFHFEHAGQMLKAAQHYMGAAVWVGASNSGQALQYWKKIRTLLNSEPPGPGTNYLRMMANGQIMNSGWREGMSADEAKIYFEEARDQAISAGDVRANALIVGAYGRFLGASGSADEYVTKIQQAKTIAAETNNASVKVMLTAGLCHALRLSGRMSQALLVNIEATDHAHEIGKADREMLGFDIGPWLTAMRGQTLVMLGRGDEARPYLDRVIQMDPANVDAIHHAVPSFGYMDLAWARTDTSLAELHAKRILALAEKSGIPYLLTYGRAYRGLYRVIAGSLDEGIDELAKALSYARERRAGLENEGRILADIANAHRLKGDLAAAQHWAVEAIGIASARHNRVPQCFARIVLAETLAEPSAVERELNAAERLLEETGARIYEPMIDTVRSKLSDTGRSLENFDNSRRVS